ncbi:unnamed protein product [Diabrotica balteata]|uniref:Uncharacterized protein n=1 Tax=Diabrotica balteata TaxID=107213 RepID=A0A9N9SWK9_DIABA|nr:unnamed protein product [Diabrotica balteata]
MELESSTVNIDIEEVNEKSERMLDEAKKYNETFKLETDSAGQLELHVGEIFYECYFCDFITKNKNLFNSHKVFAHPRKNGQRHKRRQHIGSQEKDGEKNGVEENCRNKRKVGNHQTLSDDEKKLLLQCVSKFQLHKYYESVYTIKAAINDKWTQLSKIFKVKGYERPAEKLANNYLPLKFQAMSNINNFYIHRSSVRPRKLDYIFAYLFPKYFENLSLDMNELMADAKIHSLEILGSLASTEDQECPTTLEDIASIGHLNDVEPLPNLRRPHSEAGEEPANKIAKVVHEDEDAWLKRMLDITRGRNNCDATSKSLISENNSSTDDINTLKAKLLDIENKMKERDHQLELKNLEISYLKELHAKDLEIEKMKFAVQCQNVENKN